MACKVEWTENAQDELNNIYDYLELNWTEKEIQKFSAILENSISSISIFPFMFPESRQKPNIRRCVLSKQTTMYYYVNQKLKIISILSLFDNRRNPNSLKI